MIEWIINLVFSNFWLLIILFWVFRGFSKAGKAGKQMNSPERREVIPVPRWEDSWGTELQPVIPPQPLTPVSPESMRTERKQVERQPEKKKKKKNLETPSAEPMELLRPVQGMIWSQIYGPPRSKQPHRRTRR